MQILGGTKCHKLEVVDAFCSLSGGVGHRQASPLSIVVAEAVDLPPEVGEEPMSCGEENGGEKRQDDRRRPLRHSSLQTASDRQNHSLLALA